MNRTQLMWCLVVFFGCSLLFGYVHQATEGHSALVVAGAQIGTLAVIIGIVAIVVQRIR